MLLLFHFMMWFEVAAQQSCQQLGWTANAQGVCASAKVYLDSSGSRSCGGIYSPHRVWSTASAMCSEINSRLCTVNELKTLTPAQTDCGFGGSYWSSSSTGCQPGLVHTVELGTGTDVCAPDYYLHPVVCCGTVAFGVCQANECRSSESVRNVCVPTGASYTCQCFDPSYTVSRDGLACLLNNQAGTSLSCANDPCFTSKNAANKCIDNTNSGGSTTYGCICGGQGWTPTHDGLSCLAPSVCNNNECSAAQDSDNKCIDNRDGTYMCVCGGSKWVANSLATACVLFSCDAKKCSSDLHSGNTCGESAGTEYRCSCDFSAGWLASPDAKACTRPPPTVALSFQSTMQFSVNTENPAQGAVLNSKEEAIRVVANFSVPVAQLSAADFVISQTVLANPTNSLINLVTLNIEVTKVSSSVWRGVIRVPKAFPKSAISIRIRANQVKSVAGTGNIASNVLLLVANRLLPTAVLTPGLPRPSQNAAVSSVYITLPVAVKWVVPVTAQRTLSPSTYLLSAAVVGTNTSYPSSLQAVTVISSTEWVLAINTVPSETLTVKVLQGAAADAAGLLNPEISLVVPINSQITRPVLSITSNVTDNSNANTVLLTIVSSQTLHQQHTFLTEDLKVFFFPFAATPSNFVSDWNPVEGVSRRFSQSQPQTLVPSQFTQLSPRTFSAVVSIPPNIYGLGGQLRVQVPAGAVLDTYGTGNLQAAYKINLDNEPPKCHWTAGLMASSGNYFTFPVTIRFSELVAGYNLASSVMILPADTSFRVRSPEVPYPFGTNWTFTAEVAQLQDRTSFRIQMRNQTVFDRAGNSLVECFPKQGLEKLIGAPTVKVTDRATDVVNSVTASSPNLPLTFSFSSPVSSLTPADFEFDYAQTLPGALSTKRKQTMSRQSHSRLTSQNGPHHSPLSHTFGQPFGVRSISGYAKVWTATFYANRPSSMQVKLRENVVANAFGTGNKEIRFGIVFNFPALFPTITTTVPLPSNLTDIPLLIVWNAPIQTSSFTVEDIIAEDGNHIRLEPSSALVGGSKDAVTNTNFTISYPLDSSVLAVWIRANASTTLGSVSSVPSIVFYANAACNYATHAHDKEWFLTTDCSLSIVVRRNIYIISAVVCSLMLLYAAYAFWVLINSQFKDLSWAPNKMQWHYLFEFRIRLLVFYGVVMLWALMTVLFCILRINSTNPWNVGNVLTLASSIILVFPNIFFILEVSGAQATNQVRLAGPYVKWLVFVLFLVVFITNYLCLFFDHIPESSYEDVNIDRERFLSASIVVNLVCVELLIATFGYYFLAMHQDKTKPPVHHGHEDQPFTNDIYPETGNTFTQNSQQRKYHPGARLPSTEQPRDQYEYLRAMRKQTSQWEQQKEQQRLAEMEWVRSLHFQHDQTEPYPPPPAPPIMRPPSKSHSYHCSIALSRANRIELLALFALVHLILNIGILLSPQTAGYFMLLRWYEIILVGVGLALKHHFLSRFALGRSLQNSRVVVPQSMISQAEAERLKMGWTPQNPVDNLPAAQELQLWKEKRMRQERKAQKKQRRAARYLKKLERAKRDRMIKYHGTSKRSSTKLTSRKEREVFDDYYLPRSSRRTVLDSGVFKTSARRKHPQERAYTSRRTAAKVSLTPPRERMARREVHTAAVKRQLHLYTDTDAEFDHDHHHHHHRDRDRYYSSDRLS